MAAPVATHPAALSGGGGAQGTVYLVLLVDRKGSVRDSIAEQVNLRVWSSMRELERLRKMLGLAAVEATRRWRFQPPTRGEHADAEQWTVRVPVEFRLMGDQGPEYGKWQVYVPGPRTRAPWIIEGMDDIDLVPDTLVAGWRLPGRHGPQDARPAAGQLKGVHGRPAAASASSRRAPRSAIACSACSWSSE